VLPAQDVQSALALPGCRTALGVSATEPAQQLLSTNPNLAAQVATTPACRVPHNALSRLERLEQELAASRQRIAAQQSQLAAENARQDALAADLAHLRAQLTGQPLTPGVPAVAASSAELPTAGSVHYTPGKGFSLQAGGSSLRLWAEAKLLGFSSSRYTFNPGQPLIVSPKDPAASYDLSAQQSMVYAAFRGPKWGSWTPGAFALFWLQDNLLAEGYSFTPVVLYGDIGNGAWRVAAGQNFDVFAPAIRTPCPTGSWPPPATPVPTGPNSGWSAASRRALVSVGCCSWRPPRRSPPPCPAMWIWPISRARRSWRTTAGPTWRRASTSVSAPTPKR